MEKRRPNLYQCVNIKIDLGNDCEITLKKIREKDLIFVSMEEYKLNSCFAINCCCSSLIIEYGQYLIIQVKEVKMLEGHFQYSADFLTLVGKEDEILAKAS